MDLIAHRSMRIKRAQILGQENTKRETVRTGPRLACCCFCCRRCWWWSCCCCCCKRISREGTISRLWGSTSPHVQHLRRSCDAMHNVLQGPARRPLHTSCSGRNTEFFRMKHNAFLKQYHLANARSASLQSAVCQVHATSERSAFFQIMSFGDAWTLSCPRQDLISRMYDSFCVQRYAHPGPSAPFLSSSLWW